MFVKILRNLVKFPAHWKQLLSAPEISRRFFDRLLISHCCYVIWIPTETSSTSVKLHVTALKRHFYHFSENVYMSIVLRQRKAYMAYESFFLDTSIISENGVTHSVHVGQELKGLTEHESD